MAWEFAGFRPKKIGGAWCVVDAKRPTRVIEEPDLHGHMRRIPTHGGRSLSMDPPAAAESRE